MNQTTITLPAPLMTAAQLRQFTHKNTFDTIYVNSKPCSEYQARQFLFHLKDQETAFKVEVKDDILHLTY